MLIAPRFDPARIHQIDIGPENCISWKNVKWRERGGEPTPRHKMVGRGGQPTPRHKMVGRDSQPTPRSKVAKPSVLYSG